MGPRINFVFKPIDFQWRIASVLWLLASWCCIWADGQGTYTADPYAVGTPTSTEVCEGRTTTLTCDISQSNKVTPVWSVFTTSDTNGTPVDTLDNGKNRPPYNYPTVRTGDTVARLEVMASSNIDGYHFQCRLDYTPPVYSPGTGNITVTGIPSCPTGVDLDNSTLQNDDCDVSLTWEQPPNTPPVTSTTVTYCPTSSPNCGNSINCTSPCTISGLNPGTEYQFTVIPTNNCGSPTGCTGNSVTYHHVPCQGAVDELSTGKSAGVIPEVELSMILVLFCLVALFL